MKYLLACLIFTNSLSLFSQTSTLDKRDTAKNELSAGVLNLVVFGAVDIAYERITSPSSSWSLEAFLLALNNNSTNIADAYTKDFSLTGKYKYFFGDKTASGFYANGLAMVSTGEYEEVIQGIETTTTQIENYTDLALGFGLGGKLVAKQGFFVDLGASIGRNLFNSNSPTIVGQFNANMGLRF